MSEDFVPYVESERQAEQRKVGFVYHAPRPDKGQVERYAEIRVKAGAFSLHLNEQCPPSRELSLAQTKLEEAVMWANAAIARHEAERASDAD